MPCPSVRRTPRLAATVLALAALSALTPACSKTVAASYPGEHVVRYPWRACGMLCDQAFAELEDSHGVTGKDCDELVSKAAKVDGSDDRVTAAALYDSAIVLILRGSMAEASARFAKAEALDPDPEYKDLQQVHENAAAQYLSVPSGASAPVSAPAPTAAPSTAATTGPAAPAPAPAPSESPLASPR
jgi:hypothetical protein